MEKKFYPGREWKDTDGNPIQAHGGSIIQVGNKFYLYGENKEKNTGFNGIWHFGVRMYSSDDLVNWKSEGIVMKADENDSTNPMYVRNQMDRPHILFNDKTGKFVMWMKFMSPGGQHMGVAVSDRVTGPYEYIKTNYLSGMESGDYDLVKDGNGKAYIIFEHCHTEMICGDLTEDFTGVTGKYSSHFGIKLPPLTREAPCFFRREDKMFLITSGTTGYFPNPSEAAELTDFHGEWNVLGDPCENDVNKNSFHAQFSSVFRVPFKKNLYIALGDRWLTDIPERYLPEVPLIYEALCCGEHRDNDYGGVKRLHELSSENTSKARYVWLPLVFENGKPVIRWYDSWSPEDFE